MGHYTSSRSLYVSLSLRAAAIVAASMALFIHPSAAWIERVYANGAYARWEPVAHAITRLFPWSLGDLAALAGAALIVWRIVVRAREGRIGRAWFAAGFAALDVLAIAALYAIWFEASWGWNYDRAPLETRVLYEPSRITPRALEALRARAIAEMNALAPAAHARAGERLELVALRAAWLGVVRRSGDTWVPQVGQPKATLADPFMNATGTSGFINPLTLTVQLASDLLWFERPFDLAHEWSHVAGFAREDEANYLATLTCQRSPDPAVRYSGWMQLFFALPPLRQYRRSTFAPLVWSDFAAIRARDARRVNLSLARLSWHAYNAYLKSNRIVSGVASYDEVTRLMLAIPLDRSGLPVTART
ncbi:MAG: DUF3810 family protein [Candidatus Tyrphobacter sp.]